MMATIVKCPVCNKNVEWTEENAFRPFCSLRCKQVDLGAWADEKYRVPVVEQNELSEEEASS